MNILVCLKQILDPEIPSRDFRIRSDGLEADRGSAAMVMNIFCANALETALQFRDQYGGKITVITLGDFEAEEMLRQALALRVDSAVLVTHAFPKHPGSMAIAQVIAAGVRKLGDFDLVLTGRESGDWGDGQTGGILAECLERPCISFVDDIKFDPMKPGIVQLRRQTDLGCERIEAAVPIVVTVSNHEHNVPRIAKTRDVMQAHRQPMTKWNLSDIGIDIALLEADIASVEIVGLSIPEKKAKCEMIAGATLDDRIDEFARRIMDIVQSA